MKFTYIVYQINPWNVARKKVHLWLHHTKKGWLKLCCLELAYVMHAMRLIVWISGALSNLCSESLPTNIQRFDSLWIWFYRVFPKTFHHFDQPSSWIKTIVIFGLISNIENVDLRTRTSNSSFENTCKTATKDVSETY